MKQHEELAIKRIVVAVDASAHSLAALRAAAELASSLGAKLHGLFVEDVNLLRAAELPMARELRFPFASHARMDPRTMRHQLHAQAHHARRALSSLCRRRDVSWTFQVVQGRVSATVLDEARRGDLLCVGRASRPVLDRPGIGSTARAAAVRAEGTVLLVSEGTHLRSPVVTFYDGSPEADRALPLACHLARLAGGLLSVLLIPDQTRPSSDLQDLIAERLVGENLRVRYRQVLGTGVAALIEGLHAEGCGILVLSAGLIRREEISLLLDQLRCPTLLVR